MDTPTASVARALFAWRLAHRFSGGCDHLNRNANQSFNASACSKPMRRSGAAKRDRELAMWGPTPKSKGDLGCQARTPGHTRARLWQGQCCSTNGATWAGREGEGNYNVVRPRTPRKQRKPHLRRGLVFSDTHRQRKHTILHGCKTSNSHTCFSASTRAQQRKACQMHPGILHDTNGRKISRTTCPINQCASNLLSKKLSHERATEKDACRPRSLHGCRKLAHQRVDA